MRLRISNTSRYLIEKKEFPGTQFKLGTYVREVIPKAKLQNDI